MVSDNPFDNYSWIPKGLEDENEPTDSVRVYPIAHDTGAGGAEQPPSTDSGIDGGGCQASSNTDEQRSECQNQGIDDFSAGGEKEVDSAEERQ